MHAGDIIDVGVSKNLAGPFICLDLNSTMCPHNLMENILQTFLCYGRALQIGERFNQLRHWLPLVECDGCIFAMTLGLIPHLLLVANQ